MTTHKAPSPAAEGGDSRDSAWAIFAVFLRLGLTSFGGPVAHLGYFREEFVNRRRWLSDRSYADLVALCQFLPGPASSQVGMALGLARCGYRGALAAWAGFTLPSAIALILLALGMARHADAIAAGVLHGLKLAAFAVVANAVWGMARSLCTGAPQLAIMALAACVALLVPGVVAQMGLIVAAGMAGLVMLKPLSAGPHDALPVRVSRRAGTRWLLLLVALLAGLPMLTGWLPWHTVAMVDAFFRAGALVFGGGHVVLPLLESAVVPAGWISTDVFLAGYGAAQAVPGPLFTFAAFLGASMNTAPSGWLGGAVCLLAVFAPSFLLIAGALPFWEQLRHNARMQAALAGVNAAVVGLLLATLWHPVVTSAIQQPRDLGIALAALATLMLTKAPVWLVVLACGVAGYLAV